MFIYIPFLNRRWKTAAFRIQITKIMYILFILSILTSTVGMKPAAAVGPCDSPANEIIAENCKTGNPSSEWDISGAGDSTIQGFATDISVNRGGTINFKVDTVASSFQIKIYRLGYYNGLGARLIDTIPDTATTATTQPACTNSGSPDFLVDCGGWSVSASWAAIDPTYDPDINAVSGLYIARLERTDGTSGASHIPFIVRDDDGNSDLLFQTSDTTWQAYNGYGGYSLYAAPNHAHKVSYNRPFSTRSNAPEDYFMNAEYPMLRWLERNGYDVSYFTDVDSDRYGSEILEHKVFLSVGHDEYWSAGQRTAVEAARDAGVHLAFFSGNEIYWKTRWEPSTADGGSTPYRTLVSYKEGDAQGSEHYDCLGNFNCDPDPDTWTGLWRQNQTGHDGGQPENSLSGQISWGDATSAIQVPALATGLRFWRYTGMIGATTLTYGTLGYEFDWEQAAYANIYPLSRITLSDTTVGGKNHMMSLYRAPSGALVFGAGTVQWSWGLDGNHDRGSSTEDPKMQQATVNLFADMGVQPGSLQIGLVASTASTDTTVPTVTITSPANGATVPGGTVTITGTASDTGGVVAAVKVSTDGGTTWNTAAGTTNWTYSFNALSQSVTVQARAIDDSVNLGTAASITFTTEAQTCPCSIFTPATTGTQENDPSAVELGVKFRSDDAGYITGIRFYKTASNTGTHTGRLWTTGGVNLGTVTFSGESATGWQEMLFASPVAIDANTTYVASYHTTSGYYAIGTSFASAGIDNPPLHALQEGVDGSNGVYQYGNGGVYPTTSFGSSNYLVDVVFVTSVGPDNTPPIVNSVIPADAASNVSTSANISAIFNEPLDASTVSGATFKLRDSTNALVSAAVTYNATTRTATLDPTAALAYSSSYSVELISGTSGIKDVAGNALASDYTWSFTTASEPPPPPDEGPGGPILVVSAASNPFSRYFVEILRAEGLNEFFAMDITLVTPAILNNYDVVILGEMPLTASQVTMFTDWVNAGGNLIAMRPDSQLATLLGLTSAGSMLSEAYLLVNTASAPGQGIVSQTIQFHGTADLYTLNGATSIATLYSNATTATSNPAVTIRSVGSNGGQAAAFTYDLAKSIVYTRQGNPAWIDINGDGSDGPVRADDLFHNGTDPDWVNLDKVTIPQADEQQRLLANMIGFMNLDKNPLPRFWYFPRFERAIVVMTADDHASSNVAGRFDQYIAASPSGCSVADWECVRSSIYLYPGSTLSATQANNYTADGFEIGVHVDTSCDNYTLPQLENFYTTQLAAFVARFPALPLQASERTHCIAWSGWAFQADVKEQEGIRLDTNYYFWPPVWVADRPGFMTGSGMPMRFADTDGSMFDVYQAATQMTDESGQSYPATINSLINNAIGSNGYYGVFTANMHSDNLSSPGSDAIIASAQANSVPVISGRQLLTWLDGRNSSSFSTINWSGNTLSFSVSAGSGANGLTAMLPVQSNVGTLASITRNASPVTFTTHTIKGVQYAVFSANPGGDFVAVYAADTIPPVISAVSATPGTGGTTATIDWTTNEPATSRVDYGTAPDALTLNVSAPALVTAHSLALSNLLPNTTYYYRVTSVDASANSATSPASPATATFTTPSASFADTTVADFSAGSTAACVVDATIGDGALRLPSTIDEAFSGTTLPTGWATHIWTGSSPTVSGGLLTVSGSEAYTSVQYGSGRTLEFVATFGSQPYQHIGFGGANPPFNDTPWIMFSTGNDGLHLYARVLPAGSTAYNTGNDKILIGDYLDTQHTYRINWKADSIDFYVDNNLITTVIATIPTTMNVAVSDLQSGTPDLTVDWLRLTPYVSPCSFESRVFDAGVPANWGTLAWTGSTPTGTSLALSYRIGNTATPDGSWTAFVPVAISGASLSGNSRYIQYRATLSASDPSQTPVLNDVTITYNLGSETTPPTITDRSPGPNATGVNVTSNVVVTFSELMDAATITNSSFRLRRVGAGSDIPATVTLAGNIATLDPTTDLSPLTSYQVTVAASVADLVGNPLGTDDTWTFTTGAVILSATDTTVADFSAGSTAACIVDATIGDGALRLPGTIDEGFSGTSLPTSWTSTPWTGGTSTVSGGIVTVNGARLSPTSTTGWAPTAQVPVIIEFVATFGASQYQSAGLGAGDNSTDASGMYATGDQPWAMFGTAGTTNTLYARLNPGGDVAIPNSANYIGSSHRYRIEWRTGNVVEFFIDGVSVDSRTASFGAITMRPGISDYNLDSGALSVDWVRLTPYVSPCTFTSRVIDAGQLVDWLDLSWVGASPTGTSVGFETRSSADNLTWSSWQALNPSIASPNGRYIQYRASLGATDTEQTPVIESVTLAYAAIPEYTVTFDANGGSTPVPTSKQVTYGSAYGTLATTSFTGYTFVGWFTAASGGTQVTEATIVSTASNHTLYAQWTANPYTVTFDANGGSTPVPTSKQVTYDSAYGTLATTSLTGYTFVGWFTAASGGTQVTEATIVSTASNHTLYAQWTANSYTVTFGANGGSTPVPTSKQVTYGSAYGTLATTSLTGYTFVGWFTAASGGTQVTEATIVSTASNHTLYAQWTANSYTVTFDANGGSTPVPTSKQVTYGSAYGTLATTSLTGYTFVGWFTAASGGTQVTEATIVSTASDHTLYAQWTANPYTVTFDANGGSTPVPTSKQVTYGSAYGTLATTSFTGYTFVGWFTAASGGTQVTEATIVSTASNHTLYAQWTANPYTVTFDANGGSTPVPTSKQVTYDLAYGTLATTSLTGYTFVGWFTAASGGTQVTEATIVSTASNHTLYAQWTTLPSHTVTFDANGGTGTMAPQVASLPTALNLNTFVRTGYSFAGWNTQSGGGGTSYADGAFYSFAADIILYAQWTAQPTYTVTYNGNGNTGGIAPTDSNTYLSGAVVTVLGNTGALVKTGYTFAGWNTAANGSGTNYNAGETFIMGSANVTLYAQWTAQWIVYLPLVNK